jgi:rhamnogalacturonyl hydrolase YesR
MYKLKYINIALVNFLFILVKISFTSPLPQKSDIISSMMQVNDYWMSQNPNPGDNRWARSAYFTGNMAMYQVYPDHKYLDYALKWAQQNNWNLIHFEGRPYFADNLCCGQTYLDLFKIFPDSAYIFSTKSRIDSLVESGIKDDWDWIDAIYMAMPVLARQGELFEDNTYFNRMYELYNDTKVSRGLFDPQDALWYRDEDFSSPEDTTINGKKIFWSRGNGWVFGAHVRVLQLLPAEDSHRDEYINTFQQMAAALKAAQRSDGFWGVNLADSLDYPGPESSGTCFFIYGITWGINNAFLDSETFLPVVEKAWQGLHQMALHESGKLGFVQGPGRQPSSSQPVTYESTADYGTGAFLLAGSEVYKLAEGEPVSPPQNITLNKPVSYSSQQQNPFNPASNAIDGNILTRWSAQVFPQWIEIDLQSNYRLTSSEIYPFEERAYQYRIEVKNELPEDYIILVDNTDNTQGGVVFRDIYSEIEARFIKLTVTGAHGYTGDWVSILEFRVFGYSSSAVTIMKKKTGRLHNYILQQNFPNPFNSNTRIHYHIPQKTLVHIKIYNSLGQIVQVVIERIHEPGNYSVTWDGTDRFGSAVVSGIYFYHLKANNITLTKQMLIIK